MRGRQPRVQWGRSAIGACVAVVACAAGLSGGGTGAASAPSCPGADLGPDAPLPDLESAVRCLLDGARTQRGAAASIDEGPLSASARAHAGDMVTRGYLAATAPDGATPTSRATRVGYKGPPGLTSVVITGTGSLATPRAIVDRALVGTRGATLVGASRRAIGLGVARGTVPASASPGATVSFVVAAPGAVTVRRGESAARALSGSVFADVPVRPGGPSVRRRLVGTEILPTGTTFDTRTGVLSLQTAATTSGDQQTATIDSGRFRLLQFPGGGGRLMTEMRIAGSELRGCPARPSARASRDAAATDAVSSAKRKKKKVKKRRLWVRSKRGNYRTRARDASATVRGTRYLAEDTCAGTRIVVREGVVDVRNRSGRRVATVRAGKQVLVRRGR